VRFSQKNYGSGATHGHVSSAYLERDAKIRKAAHYLPSLLCLVSTVGIQINGPFLFRSLFDPCKLLYALKSRMHVAQVGRQIDKLKE